MFKEKFPSIILDKKYINKIYINPTIAPFSNPFFLILFILKLLPINILIAVIIIVTVGIVFSDKLVLLKSIANIINPIMLTIIEIALPISIFFILFPFNYCFFRNSCHFKPPLINFMCSTL